MKPSPLIFTQPPALQINELEAGQITDSAGGSEEEEIIDSGFVSIHRVPSPLVERKRKSSLLVDENREDKALKIPKVLIIMPDPPIPAIVTVDIPKDYTKLKVETTPQQVPEGVVESPQEPAMAKKRSSWLDIVMN